VDARLAAAAQRRRERPGQAEDQPPRAVRAQHPQQQAQVAVPDRADEAHAARVGHLGAPQRGRELGQPHAHTRTAPAVTPNAAALAQHAVDKPEHGVPDPAFEPDRTERGHRDQPDAVGHARVSRHGPVFDQQGQIGEADHQVPALREHLAPGNADQVHVAGRGGDRLVGHRELPPEPGEPLRQQRGKLALKLLGEVAREPGRGQQPEPHRPALRRAASGPVLCLIGVRRCVRLGRALSRPRPSLGFVGHKTWHRPGRC
jgi:hypothetical protein